MTPDITQATPRDLPVIRDMIKALCAHHGNEATIRFETLQEMLFGAGGCATAFLARDQGQPIGYAGVRDVSSLHEEARRFDIHHLYIAPPYRSRGVGRALITAAARFVVDNGGLKLTIGTAIDNHAAQAAYRAMGLIEYSPAPRFSVPLPEPISE